MRTIIGTDIETAKRMLTAGELVAIPTETVYGLAGNALNEDAVLKIFKAKERPRFNPLIMHLSHWELVKNYVTEIPEAATKLAAKFVPGPITFLLPKKTSVSDLLTAGSTKVAIRIPAHPVANALLKELPFPLAAPSANRFGYVSPVTAQHVYDGLSGRIPYILDGGTCQVGVESTIVDFENDEVIVRRHGKISAAEIEQLTGCRVQIQTGHETHPVAPGMLKSHYATTTPLFQGNLAELNKRFQDINRLIIGWGSESEILQQAGLGSVDSGYSIQSLSPQKSIDEVAKHLFATMRLADSNEYEVILVDIFPNEGIGAAVNDRLKRAQHEFKN